MISAATHAQLVADIGATITVARAVGKPDPTDDEIFFALAHDGFAPADIRDGFATAKAEALSAIAAKVEG